MLEEEFDIRETIAQAFSKLRASFADHASDEKSHTLSKATFIPSLHIEHELIHEPGSVFLDDGSRHGRRLKPAESSCLQVPRHHEPFLHCFGHLAANQLQGLLSRRVTHGLAQLLHHHRHQRRIRLQIAPPNLKDVVHREELGGCDNNFLEWTGGDDALSDDILHFGWPGFSSANLR